MREDVSELLDRWAEARSRGELLSVEDLGAPSGEAKALLKEHLAKLSSMTWLEEDDAEPDSVLPGASLSSDTLQASAQFNTAVNSDSMKELGLGELQEAALEAGLVTREDLARLCQSARPSTGSELASELVRLGKVTPFQFHMLACRRGKELVLGNYILLDRVGAGGMGEVFKARHARMKRIVALKLVPQSLLDSPQAVARFHREVEAVARLEHPNIVTAYDADESRGRHFLAMQFVEGSDLARMVANRGPLNAGEALYVILQAAMGLEYAHERGIIHRDIKPGNLLLDTQGQVKLLDMGLARIQPVGDPETGSGLTQEGAVMGTADYMAPEQAVDTHQADQRADIYSLGCTFYFLLTARPMYQGRTLMARLIAHREQPIPSLAGRCPEELEAIFRKMVAKNPEDRFATVTQLRAALQPLVALATPIRATAHAGSHFQAGVPSDRDTSTAAIDPTMAPDVLRNRSVTMSLPPPPPPRLDGVRPPRRFAPRSVRALAIVLALLALAATAYLLAPVIFRVGSEHGELIVEIDDPNVEVAVKLEGVVIHEKSKKRDYTLKPGDGEVLIFDKETGLEVATKRFSLKQGGREIVSARMGELVARPAKEKTIDPKLLPGKAPIEVGILAYPDVVCQVAFTPDGKQLVASYGDGTVQLWDVETQRRLWSRREHPEGVWALAVSPDGRYALSGGQDNMKHADYRLCLWDIKKGAKLRELIGHKHTVDIIVFLDNRRALSTSWDKTVRLWDVETGEQLACWPQAAREGIFPTKIALLPDGKQALFGSRDGVLRLHRLTDGKAVTEFGRHETWIYRIAINSDAVLAATGGESGDIVLWDLERGCAAGRLIGHKGAILGLVFLPDKQLLSYSRDGTIRLWDTGRGKEVAQVKGCAGTFGSLALSPRDDLAVSGGVDGNIRIWSIPDAKGYHRPATKAKLGTPPAKAPPVQVFSHPSFIVGAVAFSPDGKKIVSAHGDGVVEVWDVLTGKRDWSRKVHPESIWGLAISGDGKYALSSGQHHGGKSDFAIRVLDLKSGSKARELFGHKDNVTGVHFVDGRRALSQSFDSTVRLWDVESGEQLACWPQPEPRGCCILPDKNHVLFVTSNKGEVTLHNLSDGKEVKKLGTHGAHIESFAVSSDGLLAATGAIDNAVALWDLRGLPSRRLIGHTGAVVGLAFLPDKRLLSSSRDGTIRLWDLARDKEVARFEGHPGNWQPVAISPRGDLAVSGSVDGKLRLWNLPD